MRHTGVALIVVGLLACRGAPTAEPPPCGPARLDEARVRAALPAALPPPLPSWAVVSVQTDACPGAEGWDRVDVTLQASPSRPGAPPWRTVLTLRLSVPDARLVAGDEAPSLAAAADAAARRAELEALPAVASWLADHAPALVVVEPWPPDAAVVHVRRAVPTPSVTALRFTTRPGQAFAP